MLYSIICIAVAGTFLAVVRIRKRRAALIREQADQAALRPAYDLRWETLEKELDWKVSESKGHSRRVAAYTIAIARAMGVPDPQIKTIARGAFLHDVGKLALPEPLLRALGPLTPAEDALVRSHCQLGYEMVQKVPASAPAAEIVYAQNERYDGTGYPRRLKGIEIPLGARILAVSLALEEITSTGYAGRGQSLDAAKDWIGRRAGTHFDPEVVKLLVTMPQHIFTELRGDLEAGD